MTVHRFYAPDAARAGLVLRLPTGEAHQLRSVLRLRPGAATIVFDGHGHEFDARVNAIDRDGVTVRTVEPREPVREPAVRLTLAQAILKGRGLDTVVRDATMLGAAVIQPIMTTRSQVLPTTTGGDRIVNRWQAIAVASAKQCRRAVVPAVRPAMPYTQLLDQTTDHLRILLVEPVSKTPHESLPVLADRPPPDKATIAVGPEGGWTNTEVNAAAASGFTLLTLGSRTLRADAVPVAVISVLQFVWGDL